MLPEPFYRDERSDITIYCGDSFKILPELRRAGLVCTDPPYGLGNWKSGGGHNLSEEEAAEVALWDIRPDPPLLRLCVETGKRAIVWGGNYFGDILGPTRAPLVWDKGFRGLHLADGEIAWTNLNGTLRILSYPMAASDTRGHRLHPTQKPLAVISWCIQLSRTEGVVLDPFMGSGTTLRAAKDLGRPAIGIELNEDYCRVAVQRLGQEVFDFS